MRKKKTIRFYIKIIVVCLFTGILFCNPLYAQERDALDLLFSSEEKANLEDLIKTTQSTSKESQDELNNILNKFAELKKNYNNLPLQVREFVDKMDQAGLTNKLEAALKHFKDFDNGLSNVLKKKEKIDNIIYFYDRYRPDKNDPFRSLVVLENLFTDVENYGLPKEEKYEAFSKPHIFMIRAGLRYFKTAVKNAREGCQAIQKQIRERGGDNCISEFRGGTGTGNNNDPKISSFVNLKTGQVVCRTGIKSLEGGELWTNQDGTKIYFWDLKKWTELNCGLGTADELHMYWKLAYGNVMSSEDFILWCNNRIGEYTKARERAKMQFTQLQTVQQFNCRDEILQILSKQPDMAHLMETVNHDEKNFVAKYIFKKDDIRNLTESLVNIITGNNLFYGYVTDDDGNRIPGAAVEIKCDSKSIMTQTDGNGNFKVLGQIKSNILQGLDAEITVTFPGYNGSSVSTKVNDQCRNLGNLMVKRDDELTIYPEESQIKVGESIEFKVLYTKNKITSDVTSLALNNSKFIGATEGKFSVLAFYENLTATASIEVVEKIADIDSISNVNPDSTVVDINTLLNQSDCANVANAVAEWDPVNNMVVCRCTEDFYTWDTAQKKCVPDIQAILANSDCSQYLNTQPIWDYSLNEPICDCKPGYVWNKENTACVEGKAQQIANSDCSGYMNTQPVWDDGLQMVICDCLPGYTWNKEGTACIPEWEEAMQDADCSGYQNTEPIWDPVAKEVYCDCIAGYQWSADNTHCERVDTEQLLTEGCSLYPNTEPVYDPSSNQYFCECLPGYQWNSKRTGCVPQRKKPDVDWNSILSTTIGILNAANGNNPYPGTASTGSMVGTQTQQPVVHQSNCNDKQEAGGDAPEVHNINLGQSFGTFVFDYNTYSVKDQIIVTQGGQTIFNSGCVGESKSVTLKLSGFSSTISVRVNPNCDGTTGTSWNFTVHCPGN